MDTTGGNMTTKDMLEKIAELDYSQSQLMGLNAEMRHRLDVADEEVAMLRSENTSLSEQVKALEKIISKAKQIEAEPCRSVLADILGVKTCSEKEIRRLEKESAAMKAQNEKLAAELKSLQQERDQDKISLSKFREALQILELGIEEGQLGLQHRDEVIDQKNLLLKNAEETVEECSSIIKDLRLTNQELRKQLEDRQDEASFAVLNDVKKEESLSPPLSFAEEIMLLASSAKVKTSISDCTDPRHEETVLQDPQSLTIDLKTRRCVGFLETAVHRAGLLMLLIFVLTVMAFVASRSCAGNCDFFVRLIFQPYFSVHYRASPPI